jgi:hypothetical protein
MSTPALRRLAAGLAAPALVVGLAACGSSSGPSRADVQESIEAGDVDQATASCITDSLFEDLDEDQIAELYEAGATEDVAPAIDDAIAEATSACAGEG